jgi:hypothetical protein
MMVLVMLVVEAVVVMAALTGGIETGPQAQAQALHASITAAEKRGGAGEVGVEVGVKVAQEVVAVGNVRTRR